MEKFISLLEKSEKESENTRDKDIVIFYGTTGAGKTTSIAFLAGEIMIKEKIVIKESQNEKEDDGDDSQDSVDSESDEGEEIETIVPQRPYKNKDVDKLIISAKYSSATKTITTISVPLG